MLSSREVIYLCPVCSAAHQAKGTLRGVLRVALPISDLKKSLDPRTFDPLDLLPFERASIPDYPVGGTPLVAPARIRKDLGFSNLFLKDESGNPTGSLKDRASLLVAAQALDRGIGKVVLASTGNAASAMAGVGASCGLEVKVFVPADAPAAKLAQIRIFGAEVVLVDGTYDDAYELSLGETEECGGLNRNTAYNPMTIEGKKTAALEIFRQLGGRAPDVIFVPVGDGVILSGIAKGFSDLKALGWIGAVPRIAAVQAEGSNAIVAGIEGGEVVPAIPARTIADSIRVEVPRNGVMALKDIAASRGFGVTVSDEEIRAAQEYLGRQSGLFVEPAAACSFAGFLASRARLDAGADVVILLTGSGLKDLSSLRA